ncbi:helix-turn-helix domain-containing protein [Flagellimonas algicola]|uniref:Helix-turn-helix transcriptional regulator n=1 Tax=Flagellimonas algicola TaxID=2583815 RepID=A0ABY2WQX3_9FLAO|nr:AraC family transcriptional regulator [Allomuricauda algicola]TMU57056.1 helix-turn-helix transcriptional regulator [Allomuricauda algicola]
MFFVLGIFIAIFLELLLVAKKSKSRADKVLAIWLLLIALNQIFNYFLYEGVIFKHPHWLGVDFPLPVLNGLLLYFYAREITGNTNTNGWIVLLHLLPSISLVLLAIPFYGLSGSEKVQVFENDGAGFEWYVVYSNILVPLSGLVYAIWTLVLIKQHRKKIQDNFSNTDKKELQWLKYLSIGFVIIWLLTIFFDNIIIFSAVVVLVLFIGFFGINQLNIFYRHAVTGPKLGSNENTDKGSKKRKVKDTPVSKRYAKSGLTEEIAVHISQKLHDLMAKDDVYKNEELTLTELARLVDAHPNHLSQVINEQEGKNFYNYINSLRIKEFIKLASLPENEKYTKISLAYDCGFSSKSTFNKHFKTCTGKTPTEFFHK